MMFDIYDKDIITADDFVARGYFYFKDIWNTCKFNGTIPLEYQGKPCGELFIHAKFYPNSFTIGNMPQVSVVICISVSCIVVLAS